MLPNFIIIGGQRCATGWMSQCLREHPDVFMAQDETRFFDWYYEKGTAWWEQTYFNAAGSQKAIGEKTANYLTDINAPQRIFDTLPSARIVCCVRNPVERLYSAFLMKASKKPELKSLSIQQLVAEEQDLVTRGYYAKHLRQYYDLFPAEQILTLIYDDKMKDPHSFMQTIYHFLGVDSGFVPASLHVQTKPGAAEYSNKFLAALSRVLFYRKSPLRKIYSAFRPGSGAETWSPAEKRYLIELFEQEICDIEALLGRTLPEWRR
jgi:hypothetical protein